MTSDLERAVRIGPYLTGWERTIPERGDVAAFTRGDFTIHLRGAREVLLAGPGVREDLRFYHAAARVMDLETAAAGAGA